MHTPLVSYVVIRSRVLKPTPHMQPTLTIYSIYIVLVHRISIDSCVFLGYLKIKFGTFLTFSYKIQTQQTLTSWNPF